jgi:(p)ppGpp synthase/HD superfamily hydrolase
LNPTVTLARAYHFAALKHVSQRRKGEAAEPYMNHLTEVAELVARATGGEDIDVVVAAILHDTVEVPRRPSTNCARPSARAWPRWWRR